MNYLNLTPKQFCDATGACSEGRAFALTQPTMADVWDKCPRPDWLLWILCKLNRQPNDRTLRLFAVWCARNTPMSGGRKTGDMLTDPRSLAALEVAERYANGNATDDELAAAGDAAWAAAWAAALDASRAAAGDAAWAAALDASRAAAGAAAGAAAWAASRAAAGDAAGDAAGAASRAAAGDAAGAAALDAAWDAQADQLRKIMPNPFAIKEDAK